MKRLTSFFSIILLILSVFVFNCAKKEKASVINLVDKIPDYPLSSTASIPVVFNISKQDTIPFRQNITKDYVSIMPEIPFHLQWSYENTLVLYPEGNWIPGEEYVVVLHLDKIFPETKLPSGQKDFIFKVRIAKIRVSSLKGDFIPVNQNDPRKVFFSGKIVFSDQINKKILDKKINLRLDGKNLPFTYEIHNNGQSISIKTEPFTRASKTRVVELSAGDNGGFFERVITRQFELESIENFKVKNVSVNVGKKNKIIITFSDWLQKNQPFKESVIIQPGIDYSISVHKNEMVLEGNFKPGKMYTITVLTNLKSRWGEYLKEEFVKKIRFEDLKPEIVFADDGIYLPVQNRMKVHFRSVNVKAVRCIIRNVFPNNIGQFLQSSQLKSERNRNESFNDLKKVGLVLKDTVLKIHSPKNKWVTNEIDLSFIHEKYKGSIIILHLSFERQDMIYGSGAGSEGYYYGDNYYDHPYGGGYIWRHGNIFKVLQLTDIGLSVKRVRDGWYFYTTNLNQAKYQPNVKIELYSYQNQLLASGITDGNGSLFISQSELKWKANPFYIVAKHENSRTFLKFNEMAWNVSTFDIGGVSNASRSFLSFLYTDRGVYRPGDSIYVSGIIRNLDYTLPPDGIPVKISFIDSRGKVRERRLIKNIKEGMFAFVLTTKLSDPTGNYSCEFSIGPDRTVLPIRVEMVEPERLKIKIEGLKPFYTAGENRIKFNLDVKYLFGAPASDSRVEVVANLEPTLFRSKKYNSFYFGHQGKESKPVFKRLFDGKLNQNGQVTVEAAIPRFSNLPSILKGTMLIKAYEKGGGKFSRSSAQFYYSPYPYLIGIRKPKFQWGVAETGKNLPFKIIAVTPDNKVVSNKKLTWRVYRNDYYWWWEFNSYREYKLKFKSSRSTSFLQEGTIVTKNEPVDLMLKFPASGTYLIEVEDPDNGYTAGIFVRAAGWGEQVADESGAAILKLASNKKEYYPDEKAVITFPSPAEGMALLTVEKNDRLLESRWISLKQGQTSVELPIKKEYVPNVYVSVSLFQPYNNTVNDRPIRTYGILPITVKDNTRIQKIAIQCPDEVRPGKPFKLIVKNNGGTKSIFTIAIVDEGLLSLTNFKTPDPVTYFFRKEKLGTLTYDMYDYVIGALKGEIFKVFSIGGGVASELMESMEAEPVQTRRFKPVVIFKGPLETNDNGVLKQEITIPNYMGEVRIMVVGANATSFGFADKRVKVKDDIILMPQIPRFFRPQDSLLIPVNAFITNQNIKSFTFRVKTEGPVQVPQKYKRGITWEATKDINYVPVFIKSEIGVAHLEIKAETKNFRTEVNVNVPVQPANPRMVKVTEQISKDKEFEIRVPEYGLPGTRDAYLLISAFPPVKLTRRLYYLIHYPYGCIEQTTSSVFPQLYLNEVVELPDWVKANITNNINAGIRRLRIFQLPDGGFSFWPGGRYPSEWGTNYAGHFLLEASRKGYYVPSDLIDGLLSAESQLAKRYKNKYAWDFQNQAYRLYILAMANKPMLSAMNSLRENHDHEMDRTSLLMLAAAYQMSGESGIAEELAQKAESAAVLDEDDEFWYGTYGSVYRDKALRLILYNKLNKTDKAYQLAKEIAEALSSDVWMSTQTTAWCLIAYADYLNSVMNAHGAQDKTLSGWIKLPNGKKISFKNKRGQKGFSLRDENIFGNKIKVQLDRSPSDKVHTLLTNQGIPLKMPTKAEKKNLNVSVEYYGENGERLSLNRVKQGQPVLVKITCNLTTQSRKTIRNMALSYLIPSGTQIINLRMNPKELPSWIKQNDLRTADYVDYRDDRVNIFFAVSDRAKVFWIKWIALTPGSMMLPTISAKGMYNENYRAVIPGKKIRIIQSGK